MTQSTSALVKKMVEMGETGAEAEGAIDTGETVGPAERGVAEIIGLGE